MVICPNKDQVLDFKAQFASNFEIKELGPIKKILGIQISNLR